MFSYKVVRFIGLLKFDYLPLYLQFALLFAVLGCFEDPGEVVKQDAKKFGLLSLERPIGGGVPSKRLS